MQALAAAHSQQQPPSQLQSGGDYDEGGDPLSVLQDCIQHLHFQVIPALPDAAMTNQAVSALKILTGVQDQLSRASNGPQPQG